MGELGLHGMVPSLTGIGVVKEAQGEFDKACDHFTEAVVLSRKAGTTMRLADSLLHLTGACSELGTDAAVVQAKACLREAVLLRRDLKNYEGIGRTLEAAACFLQKHGDPCDAIRLWGAYDALYRQHPAMHQTPQQQRRRTKCCTQLYTLLGDTGFHFNYQEGAS